MADLLPAFHADALDATGGVASVLLRLNPRTGKLQAESAAGVEFLDFDPWLDDEATRADIDKAWSTAAPVAIAAVPELQARLGAATALVVPLSARDERLGLLLVGFHNRPCDDAAVRELTAIAHLLAVALERARLNRVAELQRDLRDLVTALTRDVSSPLHLGASLEIFCDRAARLFAADRVSIWLHDRRARQLELVASSDAAQMAARRRAAIDDCAVPVAAVLRRDQADVVTTPSGPPDIVAALRGYRRALGTLELTGVRIEAGDAVDLLDRVEEVARQLSAAVENLWLLEDVLRSRRELESTFNSLTDLVVVCDQRLRVTQANRAFAARAGRAVPELIERPLGDFLSEETLSWIRGAWSTASATESHSQEAPDPLLHGTFFFTISPLIGRDEERVGTVIVARDVTAQAQFEAEREELRARLTQSEKLAALGQFVAGIAHELNNPLQGVLGHTELMLQTTSPSPSKFKRELRMVLREADRAAKIVHNLLVFAGSRRITRRRLNLMHVIDRVLTLRGPACAAAGIEIVKDVAPRLPRVAGDSLLLHQALLNIVINAEQAMAGANGQRRLEVHARAIGRGDIEIAVADTGPGIPPESLPRLFEPFFTTKPVGQGTGLGLAIAYGIVQEHFGELRAGNRAEGGAVFTIVLPAGLHEAVQ